MIAVSIIVVVAVGLFLLINYSNQKKRTKRQQSLRGRWGKKRSGYVNLELINLYGEFADPTEYTLSEQTVNDLDIDEVFKEIDHTYSRIGQQFLYAHLQKGNAGVEWLSDLEQAIERISTDNVLRTNIIETLDLINETSDYYFPLLFQNASVKTIKHFWVVPAIQLVTLSSFVLLFINPLFFFPFSLSVTASIGLHYWNKWQVAKYQHILKRFSKFFHVADSISQIQQRENFFKLEDQQQQVQSLKKLKRRLGLISFGGQPSGETEQVGNLFMELFNMLTLLEVSAFNKFFKGLPAFKDDFFGLFTLIGSVDLAVSVTSWRSSLTHFSQPIFTENQQGIFIENAVHPLLYRCVANTLELSTKSMLLTGSNMAGKTTFIRTVGLNVLFAQTLNTVLATNYEAPVYKLSSAIRFKDNVLDGQSYYLREVDAIKKLLNISEGETPVLFIIDELFKGTNTIERIAAASGVLSYLNQKKNLVLVSTHDIELTELLKENGFENYFFQESIINEKHVFTYKLKKGVLKERNALRLLEIYGYPEKVTETAAATLKVLENIDKR